MRITRFAMVFRKIGSDDMEEAMKLSRDYIKICPMKEHLVEGALEVLDEMNRNYRLHIITNGFSDTQRLKLRAQSIEKYFKTVVISDETPYSKPERGIFMLAAKMTGADTSASLMVGDDGHNDIEGARNAGIDQVYFNPEGKSRGSQPPSYEISRLRELPAILSPGIR